ncbi:MAG: resolvase [Sporolactobacillus laevolacticus]|nr:resolvase [Sporolactobacillus laevolacticus]
MKVVIYIRVSTKMQATEDKYSLRAQKTELLNYAKQKKWTVVDIKKDIDSGGKFEKKGLEELMDMADEGKMDAVLVLDQTRLSRLDGLQWEMLKAVLKDNNIKLAEPGTMVDLNDEVQEFMSDLQNWFARRGRKDTVKTLMRGKRQMMREGKFWGKVPFEYLYDKDTGTASLKEEYAWTIPTIDELFLKKQAGYVTISNKLNKIKYQPNGKPWNETLVYRRLISKSFHGIAEKSFATGETIVIPDFFPKLRTEETYKAIQEEILRRHNQYHPHWNPTGKLHFLRRTKMICGECGRIIGLEQHGSLAEGEPKFYLKHGRKRKISDQSVCDITINTVRCDHNIIQAIKEILTDESLAKKYIGFENNDDELKMLRKKKSKMDNSLLMINQKIDRLMDLYLDGTFDKSKLDSKKKNLENESVIYSNQKSELEIKIDLIKKNQWNYDLIYHYFEIAENFDTDLTSLERAQMIGTLFPTATVYYDKIILHGQLPIGTTLDIKVKVDEPKRRYKYTMKY